MNVLIVEDEGLLARRLKTMLGELEAGILIKGITNSVSGTVEWLSENSTPDLIFMDIELADGRCFDIFQSVTIRIPVIFITAYDEFALQAFKVNSVDYLLKPVKKEELKGALEKYKTLYQRKTEFLSQNLQQLLQAISRQAESNYRERFLVKSKQRMISVETKEIAYFTVQHTVNFLIAKDNQKFIIEYGMDELEKMLDPRHFFRANRQFLIAHDIITGVHPWFNNKLKVELSVSVAEEIIVSREKAAGFKAWMGA